MDPEQLLLQTENRPQCECGTACTSQDPLHWVHFQHTPRSPTASASSHGTVLISAFFFIKNNIINNMPIINKYNNNICIIDIVI